MTAFALPNDQPHHRLGVTVSKKTAAQSCERNRAKRLLRETFRLNKESLRSLAKNYDWVLNGRRTLLSARIWKPVEEFEQIIKNVATDEKRVAAMRSESK
jgi:ribonuclease P protein component